MVSGAGDFKDTVLHQDLGSFCILAASLSVLAAVSGSMS